MPSAPRAASQVETAARTVIAIDGPAASGKSSTAALVARALGYRHLDSGALYRAETARRLGVADLRSAEVTAHVSRIAQLPDVRAMVDDQLRQAAAREDVVVDGRDMGGVVFPDARLKIFLVATPEVRALRRLLQRAHGGAHGGVHGGACGEGMPTEAEIAAEAERLVTRDARDAAHTIRAPDAVLLDTTHLTQEEQVRHIVGLARATSAAVG